MCFCCQCIFAVVAMAIESFNLVMMGKVKVGLFFLTHCRYFYKKIYSNVLWVVLYQKYEICLRGWIGLHHENMPFGPLKSHFYTVKHYFSSFCLKHRLWYSLEPPRPGGSNEYPQSMFWAVIWKISQFVFYLKILNFWRRNFLYIWIDVFS